MKKTAVVLSGGGCKGAWAGGVLQYLTDDLNKDYDFYIGTSTGSLLAPLASIREIQILKQGYSSVSAEDIFSYNPFNKDGSPSYRKMLYRIATFKTTLGESLELKKFIRQHFKEKH